MNSEILSPEKELELINKYTRTPLTADDVYTFTVTLCDNEVDRDFECFSVKSLEKLRDLFIGKTGIADHSMRSEDQSARIYHCYIESDPQKKTSKGEAYTALKAKAYTLRTDSNSDFIASIDGGIRKEVSIGCAVSKVTIKMSCFSPLKKSAYSAHNLTEKVIGAICGRFAENISGFTIGETQYDDDVKSYKITGKINFRFPS